MLELSISGTNYRVQRASTDRQMLLHCDPRDATELAKTTGLQLPEVMLTSAQTGDWSALHLSPDEWLMIGERTATDLGPLFADASKRFALSLVDVSERSLSIEIEGSDTVRLLNGACPLDFDLFGPRACSRTLFGKVTILLWRRGQAIRLSYPRSFDGYVCALLSAIAADLSDEGR